MHQCLVGQNKYAPTFQQPKYHFLISMFLAAPISYQVKRIIQLIKAKPIAKVSDSFNIFQLIQSAKFQGSFEPFPD